MITVYHYDLAVVPELNQDQKDRPLDFALALSRGSDAEQYGTFILSEYEQELPDYSADGELIQEEIVND